MPLGEFRSCWRTGPTGAIVDFISQREAKPGQEKKKEAQVYADEEEVA